MWLLPALVVLACGCAGAPGASRNRPRLESHPALSPDGTRGAFVLEISGERPEQLSWRYVITDLAHGTPLKWGPYSPEKPIVDRAIGWSDGQHAFVIRRERSLGPRDSHGERRIALEILTSSPEKGERSVHTWPFVAYDKVRDEYDVRILSLTARQDGVLFAETVGADATEQQQQRLGRVDLDTGKATSLALLPAGWRCWTVEDQTRTAQSRPILVVAEKGDQSARETALFAMGQGAAKLTMPLSSDMVAARLAPHASALAFLADRGDDRYDLRIMPLTEGVGQARYFTRTVATLHSRQSLLWSPTGRELLVWFVRYTSSGPGREPWLLVDAITGETRRVDHGWTTIDAVQWEPRGKSLLVAADGALWRLNPDDSSTQRVMAIPSPPK